MAIIWKGSTALVEAPDSPEWQFGDQVRLVRRFGGLYSTCVAAAPLRGAIGTGIALGLRVSESKVTRQRASVGLLTITYETLPGQTPAQGQQLPDDEAGISDDEVEEQLKNHPNYADLSSEQLANINTVLNTAWSDPDNQEAYLSVAGDALALELLTKLQRGFSHYPVAAPVYSLTSYYWSRPATISSGNVRESPPTDPIIPPAGLDWLRKADRLSHNGTYWVLTRRWQGYVNLDADVYP